MVTCPDLKAAPAARAAKRLPLGCSDLRHTALPWLAVLRLNLFLVTVSLDRKSILLWYHVSARQNEIFGAIENCLLTQNHIFQVG
jgi:hypothetical protein